ncbi:MAG: phospho-sugar mutase [Ilumatobacter sp.]|jgi:phosphomannomutase|uniref:phospho-sugar mutase n=1 Tax=Ilumatobacter sp. TaxID=1967498 RepID=UPI002A2A0526|nr:phospho-sugar mutase [Ilumatobacter sp.]MBT5865282.1 phospho-sugar mutase [Ilumatobacter sp.]MDG0975790.1 phospho-sugar mutase [Ilumatobacter sp.]MDG1390907.1 phospho-sugar mutase [Ilumatobacter sp.]MDG2234137.1 phospho-sugar mutase [Ilumatobacter sp.]
MADVLDTSLLDTARSWLAAEPDDDIRAELAQLIAAAERGHTDELAERFAGRLQFGTAGLRAAVAAGPMRMNRLVVRQAAAGLGRWLLDSVDDAADRGVVIARDARRKSDVFAIDTARVLAAMGIKSMLHPGAQPTPVLAWSITGLNAAAGVVVTASHNPPADNGYKVFLETGSQIVTPIDTEIAERIGDFNPLDIPIAAEDDHLISWLDTSWSEAYVADAPRVRLRPEVPGVQIAYTAMHGVGGDTIAAAFTAAGFDPPTVVAEQQEPDGTFPTVSFPNPEEPGAMDLLLAVAQASGAAVALANDPDADRLGAAIPDTRDGAMGSSWRKLSGDEIGWLFADHILRHTNGSDRLVVTTLVSSSLLARMAEAHGVHSEETFTGFKWIGRIASERAAAGQRFVFGYEQALGYLVAARPLDKDGITAAVLMAEIAALAEYDGVTVQGRLDAIADQFGRYVTSELSVRMPPADGAKWVQSIEAAPPSQVGGIAVESVTSYPEANLVRLMLTGGTRLQIRPSGTEPKVKLYGEAVDLDPAELDRLLQALAS